MSYDRRGKENLGEIILKIEALAMRDPGGRGLARRAPRGVLGPAAFELLSSRRVAIVTGFCVRAAGIGETDGPPGALSLGRALRILGKKTVLLTDRYSLPLLKAGAKRLGIPFRALELPVKQTETDAVLERFVSAFKPTHVLALERPGSAPDGHRYSMRAEILDDVAPAADRLFGPQPGLGWVTLAVGDGGNELGMGSLRDSLKVDLLRIAGGSHFGLRHIQLGRLRSGRSPIPPLRRPSSKDSPRGAGPPFGLGRSRSRGRMYPEESSLRGRTVLGGVRKDASRDLREYHRGLEYSGKKPRYGGGPCALT